MRGYEKFNFPAFEAAAKHLRELGHEVVSPHELDSPAIQSEALGSTDGVLKGPTIGGETPGQILGRDVQIIIDKIKTIVFLPGWRNSKGAKIEAFVGVTQGCSFGIYFPSHTNGFLKVGKDYVREQLLAT